MTGKSESMSKKHNLNYNKHSRKFCCDTDYSHDSIARKVL